MNEIEKMYENAGISKKIMCEWTCEDRPDCNANCSYYGSAKKYYSPFTAEKQLELIKEIVPGYPLYYASGDYDNFSFEESLACIINRHWEYWNDKQKQQIKEILESNGN